MLRDALVTAPQQEVQDAFFARTLVEAPTQVESHRYQRMQVADWMCGLIGRIEARTRPDEYPDDSWTKKVLHPMLKTGTPTTLSTEWLWGQHSPASVKA